MPILSSKSISLSPYSLNGLSRKGDIMKRTIALVASVLAIGLQANAYNASTIQKLETITRAVEEAVRGGVLRTSELYEAQAALAEARFRAENEPAKRAAQCPQLLAAFERATTAVAGEFARTSATSLILRQGEFENECARLRETSQ
jgi:hypothetical protein